MAVQPGGTCSKVLIQPPWPTMSRGAVLVHALLLALVLVHELVGVLLSLSTKSRTRCATVATDSPPPGAWCSRSSAQTATSSAAMSSQRRPSQRPKSTSANSVSTCTRHPHRASQRPTSRARRNGDTHTACGRLRRRAHWRMRCARRLALRGSTGRSVRPMQRPAAPRAGGWRQHHSSGGGDDGDRDGVIKPAPSGPRPAPVSRPPPGRRPVR